MTSNQIGNTTEAIVLAALVKQSKTVLIPWGGGEIYDLAFEENGILKKVQCKTGYLRSRGAVTFNTSSTHRKYGKEIDFFGVYCPQNGKIYLVPREVTCDSCTSLRVELPKNNQKKGILMAQQFEI